MAATIKPIEAKSVHQIQSGQVIVDLCSVVKELVENALDAEANAVEVRFKNYGLESIEVQDNGIGISEANYETLALKHYTSKLSTYDDLSHLQTFGFRGEALSSLCALSSLSVTTAQAHEAPKGKRLEFETSGKLRSTTFTAAQKGTTVTVENLFSRLPVRQKELSKNVKKEYGKVLALLHAYACISTNVKFTVKNAMPKARSNVIFSTKGNATTRENIANVYGAKMLSQLIELNLKLDFQPTPSQIRRSETDSAKVEVVGHISRPVFGEGRQTPDRQMFFVNGRPCGLPQIAKAINEVYKSYNVSQSPFIFADFRMDTNNYDVNVSPDKRTILLHDATALTDRLKEELTQRFDDTEQIVPQSLMPNKKLPAFRQLTASRDTSREASETCSLPSGQEKSRELSTAAAGWKSATDGLEEDEDTEADTVSPKNLLKVHFSNKASTRDGESQSKKRPAPANVQKAIEKPAERVAEAMEKPNKLQAEVDEYDDDGDVREAVSTRSIEQSDEEETPVDVHVRDFNARMQEQQSVSPGATHHNEQDDRDDTDTRSTARSQRIQEQGVVPNAFNRMRPRRLSPDVATITIGDKVITKLIGTPKHEVAESKDKHPPKKEKPLSLFSQSIRKFDIADGRKDGDVEADVFGGQPHDEAREEEYADTGNGTEQEMPEQTVVDNNVEQTFTSFVNSQRARLENYKQAQNEAADRTQEEYRVAELIRMAETTNFVNSKERQRRTNQALKGGTKDSTTDIVAVLGEDLSSIIEQSVGMRRIQRQQYLAESRGQSPGISKESPKSSEEERLSLTISKPDFAKMHIAGQFNLGFIIALRPKDKADDARQKDELFIIDQHASDEKYNFERLQAETVVGNQRLVHPVLLDLTAVEEETVLENEEALRENGFIVESDTSGAHPVGRRCKLLSLPLSKEITFTTRDLEELIHLLSESHISADSAYVPRPSKVRKMFAMRACRSSIMIGKTLSRRQMRSVLDHMGRIDKPWNCPHGRPTMRHLISLDQLDAQLWKEGDGLVPEDGYSGVERTDRNIWKQYAA